MPTVPAAFVNQTHLANEVEQAIQKLGPEVVRVRYNVGDDMSGDRSIFFRIVLSDDASREARLREIAPAVSSTVLQEVNPEELGLQYYFNFRSVSEQAQLKEESWA